MPEASGGKLDLLIDGATALTSAADRPVIEDALIGIADGRLALVAARGDLAQVPDADRRMDGRGRVVTPGFVNVHTHAILSMVRGVAEDMGFAPPTPPACPTATT